MLVGDAYGFIDPIYSTGVGLIQFGHLNQAPKRPQEPKTTTFGGVMFWLFVFDMVVLFPSFIKRAQ